MRDLLEANHWDQADKYLTKATSSTTPTSRRAWSRVMKFFGAESEADPDRRSWKTKIVSVTAEGDLVTVACRARVPDPEGPGKDVHDDLVRHVAHQGRKSRRALGLGDEKLAGD